MAVVRKKQTTGKAKKAKTTQVKKADKPVEADKPEDKKYRVQCKAGLLTYNRVLLETKEDLEEMKTELKAKFKHDVEFSICLEKESRVHCHVFFDSDEKMDCDLQYFETSKSGPADNIVNNRGKNIAQGHYYCQCKYKDSHLECVFDLKKNVCGDWLMNLWKAGKVERIEKALADENLLKPQYQNQIRACSNYKEKERVEKMMIERKARINAKTVKFAVNPIVQCWLEKYEVEEFRYDFLVLCGPSKKRKTEFAKSLFKNYFHHKGAVDWDGYQYGVHDGIIFDDIRCPKMVWPYVQDNKMLFQASGIVSVNISNTNCFKRDICVCQVPIVICTNDGLLEPFCTAPFREWVDSNCVWIDVDDPFPFFHEVNVAIEDIS